MSQKTIWAHLTEVPQTFGLRLLRVGLFCFAVAGLLAVSLASMTFTYSGREGLAAMGVALVVSLVSNVAGAVPVCWSLNLAGSASAKNLLGGMALRLIILLVLAVPLVFSDIFPIAPLLLWLALGYFAILMTETTLVANWLKQQQVTK